MDGAIGQITMFAGDFTPRGWFACEGQNFPISEYSGLYSVIGTTYGGDGMTTFALPDLRGRTAVGTGRHPGGYLNLAAGVTAGQDVMHLQVSQMPAHRHGATIDTLNATATVHVKDGTGELNAAAGHYPAIAEAGSGLSAKPVIKGYSSSADATLNAGAVTVNARGGTVTVADTGGSEGFSLVQPSLGIRHIICWDGAFPARD